VTKATLWVLAQSWAFGTAANVWNFTSPLILSHLKRFVTAQKSSKLLHGICAAKRCICGAINVGKISSTRGAVSGIGAIDSAIGPSALMELFSR